MKLFIWDYVPRCSDRYHSGGGVVVIANSEKEARKKFNEAPDTGSWDDTNDQCFIQEDNKPDLAVKVPAKKYEKDLFIFPDAGCC